jgi:hypothetical protein
MGGSVWPRLLPKFYELISDLADHLRPDATKKNGMMPLWRSADHWNGNFRNSIAIYYDSTWVGLILFRNPASSILIRKPRFRETRVHSSGKFFCEAFERQVCLAVDVMFLLCGEPCLDVLFAAIADQMGVTKAASGR